MGENLLITVDVTSMDGATPLLLARFGGVPFPGDLSAYDEHDLLSNFYGDRRHEILIDAEELAAAGEGSWYVAVTNGEASAAALTFTITATKAQRVDCPLAHGNGGECSTAGECVSQLGRCDCNAGRVLDDCSADGVFELDVHKSPSTTDSTTPDIAVDGWAYWSVIVGCGHRFLGITFTSSDEGTAPLLVVRRGRLPLMVTGTYDYWDYYTGENKHEKVQRVAVTDCEDPVVGCASGCCITPLYPGTAFATGAPEAGVYYIGVYNDAKLATKPLKSYKLDVIVRAAAAAAPCGAPCAEGFVGGSCDVACPGRMPADVYSNSPVDDGAVCSAVGSCYIDRADATASICDCGALFTGGNCEFACPAVAGKAEPCAGHGSCVAPAAAGGAAECACDYGFGGGDCAVTCGGCGGRGACDFDTLECACDDGFVGKDCEFECPFANGKTCADAGECVVRHSYTGVEKVECVCEALAHGDACNLRCPVSQLAEFASRECSGAGACDFSGNSASCTCFTGSAGAACDVNTTLLRPGGSSKKSSSGGLGVGASAALACVALVLFAAMAGAACVAEKRRREVRRYERLVREVGSSASTIITANGARHRDDGEYTAPDDVSPTFDAIELPQFNDLRDVKKAVSPFHDEAIEL
ncbi:hypothetical protein M885DRAFT_225352 [Pelagophyceae sp. CCMP2097]|nr:hypothetical protein M885DRAFT_225352 [Pelagophyceae sp. CCMP2097]